MKRRGDPRGVYKKLRINRIDLVDRGANYDPATGEGAHVTIVKSRDTSPVLLRHCDAHNADVVKVAGEIVDCAACAAEKRAAWGLDWEMFTDVTKQGGAMRTPKDSKAERDAMAIEVLKRNPSLTVPQAHGLLTLGDPNKITDSEKARYAELLAQEDGEPDEPEQPIAKAMDALPDILGAQIGRVYVGEVCKLAGLDGPDHPRFPIAEAAALGSNDRCKTLFNLMYEVGDVASLSDLRQVNPNLAREVAGVLGGF